MVDAGDNEFEFRVFAIRRSGHHAVVNWLAHCFECSSAFWFADIPFTEINGKTIYTKRNLANYGKWRKRCNKASKCKPYVDENRVKNLTRCSKKCLIHTYEDKMLSEVFDKIDSSDNGNSKKIYNVIILRDLPNLTASRLAKSEKGVGILPMYDEQNGNVRSVERYMEVYNEHIDYFLGNSDLNNLLCISYNKWFSNKKYRKSLCKKIGIAFSDAGKDIVLSAGGGSSFSRIKFHNDGSRMDVLRRYKYKDANRPGFVNVRSRNGYKKVMLNDELKKKSIKVFGI